MNYAQKMQIFKDFEKLIGFYVVKSTLHFKDDLYNSLTLFLLELIQRGKCISRRYVAVALRNKYIELSKKFLIQKQSEQEFLDFCSSVDFTDICDIKIDVRDALKILTDTQKSIVKLRFVDGLNCSEIAQLNGTSRQAVARVQKRALDKIKPLL